ncbi:hypothetical protein [Paracoccus sp. PAMC 22219]|uniref:hypothetical protein n=1 Tax=Paracoccus sp. PAMC 22219 TaxID=1569209 RepID=UPI0027D8134E|nr:hypothetical protein [Paracoccus sp. PAMC 22219]
MTLFDWIIWSGAALTLIGLGALVWCIWTVGRAARGAWTTQRCAKRCAACWP